MAIYDLRKSKNAKIFAHSIDNVRGSSAYGVTQTRAERSAAASIVRDLVRKEKELLRPATHVADVIRDAMQKPVNDELARVRARIKAYCDDYDGLSELVATLRAQYGIPESASELSPAQ